MSKRTSTVWHRTVSIMCSNGNLLKSNDHSAEKLHFKVRSKIYNIEFFHLPVFWRRSAECAIHSFFGLRLKLKRSYLVFCDFTTQFYIANISEDN